MTQHRGQNSKQINIAKYVSKFLICCAKMLANVLKARALAMFCIDPEKKTKYNLKTFRVNKFFLTEQ